MDDLVKRLRDGLSEPTLTPNVVKITKLPIMDEAANEIERLRELANGYVGAVVMVDGGFRVRLFYVDGRCEDHAGPLLPSAEVAARALAQILSSLQPVTRQ